MQVDDAVGATCVHGFGGIWGLIAIGLFAQKDELSDVGYSMCVRLQDTGGRLCVIPPHLRYDGIVWGGDTYLLGVQCLAVVVITLWSMASTFVLLFTIDLVSSTM